MGLLFLSGGSGPSDMKKLDMEFARHIRPEDKIYYVKLVEEENKGSKISSINRLLFFLIINFIQNQIL